MEPTQNINNLISQINQASQSIGQQYGTNLTQLPFLGNSPTNNLIVTGTNPAQQFAQNSQALNQALNLTVPQPPPQSNAQPGTQPGTQPQFGADQQQMFTEMATYSDPYTQMLDKISATSDLATKNLINTIKAKKANQMNNVNQEYDRLKQGLMSLGLSTGNINFTPDLVYGQIMQAENIRLAKLQELDREEAIALIEAKQAQEDKDFRLLKEKMDYYKSIKKSRLDILKESYDIMNYEAKIGELQAFQVYDELQKLSEDQKLPFLQAIANQFGIPLTALTSQIAAITESKKEKEAKAKAGSGTATPSSGYNLTPTNLKDLASVGINSSIANKIKDSLDSFGGIDGFIEENKGQLNEAQITVLKKIWGGVETPKKTVGSEAYFEYGIDSLSKSKQKKLALKLGATAKNIFSKNPEINQLKELFPGWIQGLLNEGKTTAQIKAMIKELTS